MFLIFLWGYSDAGIVRFGQLRSPTCVAEVAPGSHLDEALQAAVSKQFAADAHRGPNVRGYYKL